LHKQDPAPLPYGALQYYQIHYIIQVESEDNDNFLARCHAETKGHFGNKRVVNVRWNGHTKFVEVLQADLKLSEMLKAVMLREGEIRIDPQEDHIRIYGGWIHEDKFGFNDTMLEIADRIAMHIRQAAPAIGANP